MDRSNLNFALVFQDNKKGKKADSGQGEEEGEEKKLETHDVLIKQVTNTAGAKSSEAHNQLQARERTLHTLPPCL